MNNKQQIDLSTPLSFVTAFRFPLQSHIARKEVFIGGLWLLVPLVGWILNMGHRIAMVHNMQSGQPAWPAWVNYNQLFKDGVLTFLGMVQYHSPAVMLAFIAWAIGTPLLYLPAAILWIVATIAVPGYMSHYCVNRDPAEIFNPLKAMRRVFQVGSGYWYAWSIALTSLALSFVGILLFGIGFLFTSVWFWQAAGYSFATQFTKSFELNMK